ncbi:MAG TPA: hypothetical protein VN709_03980 [Terriglobales bacterium]|nr:hypothetical protein [Terriglobales bacterium]
MKIFNSIGHFFAWVLHVGLPAVETAAASPLATAIAGVLGSKGATAQAGIEAIAGDVLNAFDAAGAAVGASGLNVKFDQATIAAIEALYADLQSLFGKKPAPPAPAVRP